MKHYEEELEQLKARIEVILRAEKFATGRTTNRQMKALEARLHALEDEMAKLRSKVIIRPTNAPPFSELYRIAHTLVSSSGTFASRRLQGLVDSLLSDYDVLSANSAQTSVLAHTESNWQNNASQTVASLRHKFAQSYPDVIGPIISAMLMIKRGVRIVKTGVELQSSFDAERDQAWPSLHGKRLYPAARHLQKVAAGLCAVPNSSSVAREAITQVEKLIMAPMTFESIEAIVSLNANRSTLSLSFILQAISGNNYTAVDVDRRLRGEVLRIHALLLRACLNAVYETVTTQGYISTPCKQALDKIFTICL